MTEGSRREELLASTFVEVVDTLVGDSDVADVLSSVVHRCAGLFDGSSAAVMMVTPEGELRLVASSSEAVRPVENFELEADEGPGLDAYRTGSPVFHPDLEGAAVRWPRLAPVAVAAGFRSVQAHPLRVGAQVIGALDLFGTAVTAIDERDVAIGRAVAHLSSMAIFHQRSLDRARRVNEQLSYALSSRIVIEQAKGILAERNNLDLDAAFEHLRRFARQHQQLLREVAEGVVSGSVDIGVSIPPPPSP